MTVAFCISIRFLHPYPLYHGRADGEEPEWPPSPMRLFQALLNASSLRVRGRPLSSDVRQALERLETIHPRIVAPSATVSTVGYRAYVPHNQADLVSAAWHRGKLDESIASHRIEKDVRPMRVEAAGDDPPTVHYVYPIESTLPDAAALLQVVRPSVRAITHLGWGIDQVCGDATLLDAASSIAVGEQWVPSGRNGRRLRVPQRGSLEALGRRHQRFLSRIQDREWTPVPPLTAVDYVSYRRDSDPLGRPWRVFKLVDPNDDTYTHPQARLIHLAGMVRHLAINEMDRNPPGSVTIPSVWVEQFVAGHQKHPEGTGGAPHAQLSYVPLPSIGHAHTDPGVRRVMIIAPVGHDEILEHLVRRLDGRRLEPEHPRHLRGPVALSHVSHDGVISAYTSACRTWASFTPVILPGHDDRKPEKTRKLIEKALLQSGIEQPCEFDWSALSHFPQAYSAHKYPQEGNGAGRQPAGYIRPDHLLRLSAVHLRLTFEHTVPGPLTIGAGRHCGFGLMAGLGD